MLYFVDKFITSVGFERRGNDLYFFKKHFYINVCFLIFVAFLLILLPTMQVFAQDPFINNLILNPFLLDIILVSNMISTLSSPFSIYTNDPYSSYDPYALPYTTIPISEDYSPLPYPFKISNTTEINFPYNSYDTYNPVSFLNSGYPDLSIMGLGFPYIQDSIGFNLVSPFFQPSFTGAIFPFVPSVLFPGFVPNTFAF